MVYVLVLLCFVTVPIHFFVDRRSSVQIILMVVSGAVFLFSLIVALIRRPRDMRLILLALIAWIAHGVVVPVI
jgi:hypothetical protein